MTSKLGWVLGTSIALLPAVANAAWETVNLGGMDVRVYAPASTSPAGDGRALMVILHGCSQTADQLMGEGNLEPAADSMGVVMAVPNVPGGGVVAGCWDYYGSFHSRDSGHNGAVVSMTEALRDDPAYDIDPAQMYIVGFSSGGGQALILGCVAPDLYTGVGAVAAPYLGSTINEITGPNGNGQGAATLCEQFAGGNAGDLATQTGIVFNDANDFTVAQQHGQIDLEMFALTMSDGIATMNSESFDMSSLPGSDPAGTVTVYSDGSGDRIARLESMGVSHAWPAGSGMGGGGLTFIAGSGVNFSQYAAEFFAASNQRTDGWTPGGDDDDDDDSADGGSDGGAGDDDDDDSADGGNGDDGSAGGDDDDDDDDDAGGDGTGGADGEGGRPRGSRLRGAHGLPVPREPRARLASAG